MDKSKQITVSCFKNAKDTKPNDVSLLRWLEGYNRYNTLVDGIRAEPDKDRRRELKKGLPCITPSGRFTARRANGLIEHSGFIALDFDNTRDPEGAKRTLRGISNVYYAGLSASGGGIWALIPISDPEHHRRHFEALQGDFRGLGMEIDPACSDVCRLRFYSYDRNPVFNMEATPYHKLAPQKRFKAPRAMERAGDALERLIDKIEAQGRDITTDYNDWIKVGGALASVYGQGGRGLFHRISQFYPKYNPQETDRQYNALLRNPPGFTENMIFHIAKTYDVLLKN